MAVQADGDLASVEVIELVEPVPLPRLVSADGGSEKTARQGLRATTRHARAWLLTAAGLQDRIRARRGAVSRPPSSSLLRAMHLELSGSRQLSAEAPIVKPAEAGSRFQHHLFHRLKPQ